MNASSLKGIGIGCFVIAAVLAFFGWYEYNENAKKVEAVNAMMNNVPFGGDSPFGGMMQQMTGNAKLQASTPKSTVYCLVLAGVALAGGVVCFVMAGKNTQAPQ